MTIDFYYMKGSPPCTIVSMTFAALGIEHKVRSHCVDHKTKECSKAEFMKINPQQTCPTIVDDGFALWESRAIARYLVNKYGKSTRLYPEDCEARAIVDQRLDFDLGNLYSRFTEYYFPQFAEGKPEDVGQLKKLQNALGYFDTFLEGQVYAAGSEMTIADLSLVVTVSHIKSANISFTECPNVVRWLALVKSTAPKCEALMEKYEEEFKDFFDKLRIEFGLS